MDLQLIMQSVPITTEDVSSNPVQTIYTRYNSMYLITAREFNSQIYFSKGRLLIRTNELVTDAKWRSLVLSVPVNSLPRGKKEVVIGQACSY